MNSIFSVNGTELEQLDAASATRTFRNLLWCEALRGGLSPHKVVISLRTTVSDGGIDARVDGTPTVDSILVRGTTYFQVKAGNAFKPWQRSLLKKNSLLVPRLNRVERHLRQEFASVFKHAGDTYLSPLATTSLRNSTP
jgi:hypothetical protein